MEYKNPDDLKPHPLNIEIYGQEEIDPDLRDSIQAEGILNPVIINPANIIISGNRRVVIARELGIDVPCIVRTFNSDVEEQVALISFNKARIKTYIQEMREIDLYEKLKKERGFVSHAEDSADAHNESKGTFHRKRKIWKASQKETTTVEEQRDKEKAETLIKKIEADPKYTPSKAYKDLMEHRNTEKVRKVRKEAAEQGGELEDTDLLYLGDFKKVLDFIPDNSVDAIITDPPYPMEFLDCWNELGIFAEKKLRSGGWLVAYSGQKNLPEVYSRLEKSGLKYYWTMALYHNGTRQDVWGVDLNVMWKPVIIYVKPPALKIDIKQRGDYIVSAKEEKDGHEWQQSESSVRELIATYTREGDFIVEPFAGAGTTINVARMMNRKVVGAEIDVDTYNIAKNKLQNTKKPTPKVKKETNFF